MICFTRNKGAHHVYLYPIIVGKIVQKSMSVVKMIAQNFIIVYFIAIAGSSH